MKGDVSPNEAFIDVTKGCFPLSSAQFIIDEAHSVGILGPKVIGFISLLGLEKEIAIRSKALAPSGCSISLQLP